MQMFTRDTILPGVDLTYLKSDKFKTGFLSACLIAPLTRKTASYNAVLPKVLRRGTSTFPDRESISVILDTLYGATIRPIVRKRGEFQVFGFVSDFVDDKYLTGDQRIFERVTSLVAEMLIHPKTFHGRLTEEYIKSERQNLIDEIRSALNNKQSYANDRMLEHMYKNDPFCINKLGSETMASKISVATLTKHYHKVISTSKIELFYYGSLSFDRVKSALVTAFSSLPRSEIIEENITVSKNKSNNNIKIVKETMPDISQGKLSMGIRLGNNYRQMSIAGLYVFNTVYGGCVTSKLFTNVREKLSLCYYVNSAINIFKGVMFVMAGIDKDKYDEATDEILKQLEKMKSGDITSAELDSAKNQLITDFKRIMDSQQSAERFFLDSFAAGLFFTPEEMIDLIENVTCDDLVKMSETVEPDTIYFLCNEENKVDGE